MVSHSENDLYIYMVYINYWRTEFIQDIQGWLQTHSKTNSKICIHILYRRMFSDTPILWSQWFHVSSPPSRLDGTALRGLQERAAGHGVSRQSTAGSVAGLVEPRQIDTTKQKQKNMKKASNLWNGFRSKIIPNRLSITFHLNIHLNIQEYPDIHHPIREVRRRAEGGTCEFSDDLGSQECLGLQSFPTCLGE